MTIKAIFMTFEALSVVLLLLGLSGCIMLPPFASTVVPSNTS